MSFENGLPISLLILSKTASLIRWRPGLMVRLSKDIIALRFFEIEEWMLTRCREKFYPKVNTL